MDIQGMLPIGTVFLADNQKKYLIIGCYPIDENEIKYDYECVLYPQGFSLDLEPYYINSNRIVKVCFYGNINYRC